MEGTQVSQEPAKLCIKCCIHEASSTRYRMKYEKLQWLIYHLQKHMAEAVEIGEPVDSIAMYEFIQKRLSQIE
jgi:hypothetical protein